MMQQHWRQSPVKVKKLCQQSLTSDDTILESCPTNQSIIPTFSSRSTLKDTTVASQTSNANRTPVSSSAIACSILLLLISACIGITDADQDIHPLSGSAFFQIGCKGRYNSSMFARMIRICDDCHNLFREPLVYTLCRDDCFTTEYFKGCVDSLYLHDELATIKSYIEYLHGIRI